MTKKDLLKQIKNMQRYGDDLVSAIENACWLDAQDRPQLHHPTHHMESAARHWKEKDHV